MHLKMSSRMQPQGKCSKDKALSSSPCSPSALRVWGVQAWILRLLGSGGGKILPLCCRRKRTSLPWRKSAIFSLILGVAGSLRLLAQFTVSSLRKERNLSPGSCWFSPSSCPIYCFLTEERRQFVPLLLLLRPMKVLRFLLACKPASQPSTISQAGEGDTKFLGQRQKSKLLSCV